MAYSSYDFVISRIKCGQGMRSACLAEKVDPQEFAVIVIADPSWRALWIGALKFARELKRARLLKPWV